jgi:acyl-CoA thioesterase-1
MKKSRRSFLQWTFLLPGIEILARTLYAADRPVLLAMGDSLTAGFGVPSELSYPSQLQTALDARGYSYRVVNQGVSGSTTVAALGRMSRALALQPEIVILQFGGNDSQYAIPKNVTVDNLRKMTARFKSGGTRVFLAGRNPALFEDLAREEHLQIIPFLDGVAGHPELMISDGVHPTGDGYAIVVENVLRVIEPVIRQIGSRKF